MDWFRAYHGITSDPKWPIVARKAKVSIGVVVSVWLALLESASEAADRGSIQNFDPETVDALYGYEDGTCETVLTALKEKGLICDGHICAWEKRQPVREDDSAERVRQHRERKRRETQGNADPTDGNAGVTQCNASVTPQIREEKIREEFKDTTPYGVVVAAAAPTPSPDEAAPEDTPPEEPAPGSQASSCPYEKIRDMYHATFPEHPRVALLNAKRRGAVKARWTDAGKRLRELQRPDSAAERLAYFQRLFDKAAKSDFLTGKKAFRDGSVYRVDFDKLMSPSGFMGVIEGKYDNRQEAY